MESKSELKSNILTVQITESKAIEYKRQNVYSEMIESYRINYSDDLIMSMPEFIKNKLGATYNINIVLINRTRDSIINWMYSLNLEECDWNYIGF